MTIPNLFARWNTEAACLEEMMGLHDEEAARAIVAGIKQRVADDTLFKSADTEMIVLSKTDDDELVVYGPCSWEKVDPDDDLITAAAMSKFFNKWFNVVPERYQNITLNHKSFQAGIPLLTYQGADGEMYYTHVHEKGAMLISKVRNADGLVQTTDLRAKIRNKTYKSYSIYGVPTDIEKRTINDREVSVINDIDPGDVTYCRAGMNDMANFGDISKISDIAKTARTDAERAMSHNDLSQEKWDALSDEERQKLIGGLPDRGSADKIHDGPLQKPFADYDDFDDCVAQNQGKDDPDAYCAAIQEQAEKAEALTMALKGMTLEQINDKIAELRATLEANQDKIHDYYDKLPDTPDWVENLYDENSALYDELSAWREAKVERIVNDIKAEVAADTDEKSIDEILNDAFQPLLKNLQEKLNGVTIIQPSDPTAPQDINKVLDEILAPVFEDLRKKVASIEVPVPGVPFEAKDIKAIAKEVFNESIKDIEARLLTKIKGTESKPKGREEIHKVMDERTLETALRVREIFKELKNNEQK